MATSFSETNQGQQKEPITDLVLCALHPLERGDMLRAPGLPLPGAPGPSLPFHMRDEGSALTIGRSRWRLTLL